MLKGLKRQLSSKITEKLLIDVFELRHMSETGHGNIFIIILLMCATTSTMKFFFFETKFKGSKRQLSSPINKNDQMT